MDNSPFDSYDAYYKVKYWGSDKIKVSVEEEYSSKIYVKYIYEPYEAYGVADHIINQFHAWIDFTVENKYGKALYTIELGPNGEVMGIDNIEEDANEHFNVYDVKGNYIGSYADLEEISGLWVEGILVVRHFKSGKMVNTFKMANR